MMEKRALKPEFRRTVLVVDDEAINREMLGALVEDTYDVIYAANGREALEIIEDHRETLSLVLLDLMMPEMNGYEVLDRMHSDPALRRIPVIVLTSEKQAEIKSLQLGASDFIPKPYDNPDVMLARINRSIELAEDASIIQNTSVEDLTGLYKKSFFFEYCRQFDLHNPGAAMDAITININRFRLVNEITGRAAADAVLAEIGRAILEELKGSAGLACHPVSDVFFIYREHLDDMHGLLERITEHVRRVSQSSWVHLRMGVYSNVDRDMVIDSRFDRASLACDAAKHRYGDPVVFYDDRMHEDQMLAGRLVEDFEEAVRQGQFIVYYQPKYNIQRSEPALSSAEALVRWKHPELGMVSPGVFIPLFEENGLIMKLDRFVWESAVSQMASWKREHGYSIPVSINISRIDLYDPDLEAELTGLVEKYGIDTADLYLEITESAYTDDSRQLVESVTRLRSCGFKIEMDDFGSGYSSLNMLTRLPIDVLKLDMKFVNNLSDDPKGIKMIELIMDIAKYLGLIAVAEGVETAEQVAILKKAGVDIVQGYYFSKPIPGGEFEELLTSRAAGAGGRS